MFSTKELKGSRVADCYAGFFMSAFICTAKNCVLFLKCVLENLFWPNYFYKSIYLNLHELKNT